MKTSTLPVAKPVNAGPMSRYSSDTSYPCSSRIASHRTDTAIPSSHPYTTAIETSFDSPPWSAAPPVLHPEKMRAPAIAAAIVVKIRFFILFLSVSGRDKTRPNGAAVGASYPNSHAHRRRVRSVGGPHTTPVVPGASVPNTKPSQLRTPPHHTRPGEGCDTLSHTRVLAVLVK